MDKRSILSSIIKVTLFFFNIYQSLIEWKGISKISLNKEIEGYIRIKDISLAKEKP